MNARLEADRQAQMQAAAAYIASNPLPISGNQIATQYGERDISTFRPIVQPGQAVTGSTPTQLVDPQTNMPVFLSDPANPYSFTYDNTGTPAVGGTLEQQAAMFRPLENKGVFGTIGGDLLEGIKDPYFRNFAIAAAAMAAAAALAPAAAGSVGGTTAGGSGAVAYPINFGNTIITGGELAGTGGAGFLGGAGEILPGAVGTGGGSLGGRSIRQINLTSPHNLTTATLNTAEVIPFYGLTGAVSSVFGVRVSPDGTRMFVVPDAVSGMYQFSLRFA
jgi:hypothetical protein